MPYFTRQVAANGGLIVTASVGVSHARRGVLIANNLTVPTPVQVAGLIDTGASGTCIDPSVLSQLNLTPTGRVLVHTISTEGAPVGLNQYDISLMISGTLDHPPLIRQTVPVIESRLFAAQGFHALIGRDILRGCLLTYDGQSGLFSLAY